MVIKGLLVLGKACSIEDAYNFVVLGVRDGKRPRTGSIACFMADLGAYFRSVLSSSKSEYTDLDCHWEQLRGGFRTGNGGSCQSTNADANIGHTTKSWV
ncbi:hypothetical protein E8E14_002984 [Neopestalotiopsis sp. 37M]|nr:hypothetical protein E8E14_002984 [Neopestalotiopsis sp. 37M]